jgi:hypothetical protein
MLILCPPVVRHATAHVFHHLARGRGHVSYPPVRQTGKAVHHALKNASRSQVVANLVCKAIPAAIVAGGLLTGLPTNEPPILDGAVTVAPAGQEGGALRRSTTPFGNSGTLEWDSSKFGIVDRGTAASSFGSDPGGLNKAPLRGGDLASPNPFAFHGPSPFTGVGASDLRPILEVQLPDLAQNNAPGILVDDSGTSPSEAPVDEPPSGFILLAALASLLLLRRIVLRKGTTG